MGSPRSRESIYKDYGLEKNLMFKKLKEGQHSGGTMRVEWETSGGGQLEVCRGQPNQALWTTFRSLESVLMEMIFYFSREVEYCNRDLEMFLLFLNAE